MVGERGRGMPFRGCGNTDGKQRVVEMVGCVTRFSISVPFQVGDTFSFIQNSSGAHVRSSPNNISPRGATKCLPHPPGSLPLSGKCGRTSRRPWYPNEQLGAFPDTVDVRRFPEVFQALDGIGLCVISVNRRARDPERSSWHKWAVGHRQALAKLY